MENYIIDASIIALRKLIWFFLNMMNFFLRFDNYAALSSNFKIVRLVTYSACYRLTSVQETRGRTLSWGN